MGEFSAGLQWGYKNNQNGPQHWGQYYPSCDKSSQSPINIEHDHNLIYTMATPLQFVNYHQIPGKVKIINDGHLLQTSFPTASPMMMYGGGLASPYIFDDIHIHWGSNSHLGSEHAIDGVSHPVEFHLVHHKAIYDNLSHALENPEDDTLAVLAVFGEIAEQDNPKLNPLMDHLTAVETSFGEEQEIPGYAVNNFLPDRIGRFFRYTGSLTTPGCFEIVSWIVSQTAIPISEAQMEKLRSLKVVDGGAMVDNNRPVQNLNKRSVYDVETLLYFWTM